MQVIVTGMQSKKTLPEDKAWSTRYRLWDYATPPKQIPLDMCLDNIETAVKVSKIDNTLTIKSDLLKM